jgi:hypothetical protein
VQGADPEPCALPCKSRLRFLFRRG